jgi:hypothetical protein
MAIYIIGRTKCAICGKTLTNKDGIIGFPSIFPNHADPLHFLNDAVVHEECLHTHSLRKHAEQRMADFKQKTGPGNRHCRVCSKEILNPDDYLGFGHLTDRTNLEIYQYNYAHFHRNCFRHWHERDKVIALLENMVETGAWLGNGLPVLIDDLKNMILE